MAINRKYQVFISSTYTDLINERQAAVEAILKAGHIPAGMELFKSGREQLETIKKWIDESDIYLLILGKRYGSIDENSGLSYTEIEYRYAIEEKGMPGFAIIINDEMIAEKVKSGIERAKLFEENNLEKYNVFLEFVKTKIVSFASHISEIKLAVHENINQFEDVGKLVGWIRSDNILEFDQVQKYQQVIEENSRLKNKILLLNEQIEDKYSYNLVNIDKTYEVTLSYFFNQTKRIKKVAISWRQIFVLISPILLDLTHENTVKEHLTKYLFRTTDLTTDISYKNIDDQDFYTIRTQLFAYGLINNKSLKTKSGSYNQFWKLTDKGEKFMMKLRTIKEE